ncbi:4-(cytidine 5'-diphospho)-2-C-methyl-D-erythritol kinase [Amphiplicatus metriothermophilus]|uniref:4-diphosphocytidyl-2-C-methyl-D-erythritol kinase n=1 Tax=Amphiplicatus metriothermophilus TaxID=1519374 RepID=A0A239PKS3_9PROT|nr:4-(cytidine 5'-diphospho)-2-C-methyl-D-erythritol kinase [Amphiplicatus metriothermophilus]MBB5518012.1 4-diphosphocytidyl-2-C-methyl-D-erythritol kinase [Amphiplicatus metriothermophilus]SNT67654.1 4-diphosphocytidyl-2-C-methyl-D-erythritol kinase [Amphiplicatus metriothermophilus]
MIREIAPAKINLHLHVGPARADGLHAVESLFVFACAGDVVAAEPADDLSLAVEGPFGAALARFPVESNLVWRAAEALRAAAGVRAGAALRLEKNLPLAAGIGGGSADAAAALRALVRLWRLDMPDDALARLAFRLGADVPACLAARPVYVGGAGEKLDRGPRLPPLWICLANPGVETPTGPVFRAFDAANPAPPSPRRLRPAAFAGYEALRAYVAASRNDLEPHAVARAPVIAAARDFLAARPGALCARMSGSGATVFALFASGEAAARAARAASGRGWWALAAALARRWQTPSLCAMAFGQAGE